MATDAERLSKLFRNVHISQSRRGSDAGVNKAFFVAPHHSDVIPHSGGSKESGREGSPSRTLCHLHVPVPPGVNQERRGSTGNILWRKSSSPQPHNNHLQNILDNEQSQRRGSTPGDFLVPPNRKDSRKFSQDSIDLNEPFSKQRSGSLSPKHWQSSEGPIIEEEV
jgi:hypothetical protein